MVTNRVKKLLWSQWVTQPIAGSRTLKSSKNQCGSMKSSQNLVEKDSNVINNNFQMTVESNHVSLRTQLILALMIFKGYWLHTFSLGKKICHTSIAGSSKRRPMRAPPLSFIEVIILHCEKIFCIYKFGAKIGQCWKLLEPKVCPMDVIWIDIHNPFMGQVILSKINNSS